MTLVEVLIAVGIASMLLAVVAVVTLYTARSSAAVVDYVNLTGQNRLVVDRMSKWLRQASEVTSFSSSELVVMVQGKPHRYYYDDEARSFIETSAGRSRVLLEGVDALKFEIYQRNAVPGSFEQVSAGTSAQLTKLVQVSWRTSRTTAINPTQTDGVASIRIALRAK